ncbi:hypothetical protein ACEQPO_13710 [Bacillus sp. SL00103]
MTVKTIQFDQLQETVYHEKMESGLDVYVLPKQGFNKTYATLQPNMAQSITNLCRLVKKT